MVTSEFTVKELSRIRQERSLTQEQISTLEKASTNYKGKISKEDLLDTFRRMGYLVSMFEEDLQKRFGEKKEKSVRISYDLLPSGKVEHFMVQEIDQ